ncbi:MAG: LTA synthase family protein [Rhodospirillales bacterium]|nr:LTA synthase family protein [Rhodospirillales bacterium]
MNGMFAFVHAFRNNELDYDKYYPILAAAKLNAGIRALVGQSNTKFATAEGIERKVSAHTPSRKVNVVLISVESLSAEYVGRFGNRLGITPELDKLADKGLLFTNLYATGTRTVRGLEALSVGTPPTPGQSIVRRPKNDGLVTLGGELKKNGWKPYWIYGGYGYFDNMNAYFESNQYSVVDRSNLDAEQLPTHHETIWGVADEDLYSLAIANLDREYAQGNNFFAHIMTTSNHRPYTFPENRVDLPQKRREGAVKYTDWAIGDFLRRSADKPWFDNTLFIITSDHTAKAAGKTDLPPSRYHIPMIWYAPQLVEPGIMGRLMSQIDVGPTLLGWLGLEYDSKFFGYDLFKLEKGRERAFISTYQKLGYLKGDRLVVLNVNQAPVVVDGLPTNQDDRAPTDDKQLIKEAIAWYQAASFYFGSGKMIDGGPKQALVSGGKGPGE